MDTDKMTHLTSNWESGILAGSHSVQQLEGAMR